MISFLQSCKAGIYFPKVLSLHCIPYLTFFYHQPSIGVQFSQIAIHFAQVPLKDMGGHLTKQDVDKRMVCGMSTLPVFSLFFAFKRGS